MARAPYRPVELTEALRPVAQPVDTFVTAQVPSRDTNLQDLARSLSGLGGALGGLVGQRDKQAEEEDKIRGEAAFWEHNSVGAAQATADGLIPAQASPAFMRAYKITEGTVAGGVLEQKFAAAYDQWEGKASTDPKAYGQFVTKFYQENVTTKDNDILRGLIPKFDQFTKNYLQRHINDASKATMDGFTTSLVARGDQIIDAANTAGLASRKGTDYATTFSELDAIRTVGLQRGANREQIDQKLIDLVTSKAITTRDPKILDFLDRKVPGTDYTWASTPYGRDQRQKTIDTLETMGRRSIADDEKRRREEKAELKDAVTRDTITAITKDPRAPIPEELLARGERVNPTFRLDVIKWRDAVGKKAGTSDPEDLLAVTADILNGGGLDRVRRGMQDGVFRNSPDLTRAWKLAESMATDGAKLDLILKDPGFKRLQDNIRLGTAGNKDASKFFDDGQMSREGLTLEAAAKLQALEWATANPNATASDRVRFLGELTNQTLNRIKQPEGPNSAVFIDREGLPPGSDVFGAKSPGDNTDGADSGPASSPAKAAPAKPPAPVYGDPGVQVPSGLPGVSDSEPGPAQPPRDAAPTPQPPAPTPVGTPPPAASGQPKVPPDPAPQAPPADAGAWFNSLPPETRARLEVKAAEERKPLSLKAQELYEKGIATGTIKAPAPPVQTAPAPGRQSSTAPGSMPTARAPDGTPIETASASTTNTTPGSEANDTVTRGVVEAFARALNDTKRRPVGGYASAQLRDDPQAARILDFVAGPESGGSYNSFFGNARSTKDLSAMSLDQVMAWSRNRGTKSSATGRYQFMAETLKGLKDELGLSGAEAFTPALQDRLALQLLERRGYSAWRAGRITDAQFANRLALEWAALPNITAQNGRPAGVSAYAGDGLNKSLVSPAAVMAALRGRGGGTEGSQPSTTGFLGRLLGRRGKPAPKPDDETRI